MTCSWRRSQARSKCAGRKARWPSKCHDCWSLYKHKGGKSECSNYRSITLFSTAGKIVSRVLLSRLIPAITENILPESQCGFWANWGTAEMIWSSYFVKFKRSVGNRTWVYATFINLMKAFDTMRRNGLRHILSWFRNRPKFLTILQQFQTSQ